jgi:hypothetical protein
MSFSHFTATLLANFVIFQPQTFERPRLIFLRAYYKVNWPQILSHLVTVSASHGQQFKAFL